MNPIVPFRYERLTPAEACALAAKFTGSLIHPASRPASSPPQKLARRNQKRLWRANNVAKGLTVDGRPRKKRPYHPNLRHGLTKDRVAYMRWWRAKRKV